MKLPRRIWIKFKIKKLSLKDYFVNFLMKLRFQFYRIFLNSKIKNYWSSANKKGMELTFEDDFDEVSWGNVGENYKWVIGEHWGRFHPDKPNVHYVEPTLIENESHALFRVKHNPKIFTSNGEEILIPFEASLLSSAKSFRQKYGRFECRMTLPVGRGAWPAFWLWGSTWPPEIDVIEAIGDKNGLDTKFQEINLHYGRHSLNNREDLRPWSIKLDNNRTVGKYYHEFAVEWSPNKIEFFTDGIKVFQYTNKEILDKWFNTDDANTWIVINNSLRDGFVRDNETMYYTDFKVDYIRAYKFL
ncbi:MAG: glycoside hydrolase family 16 protein [bacterium]